MFKRIGFISTRFARTDGVFLKSAKRTEVLWHDNHVSHWYGGVLDRGRGGVHVCSRGCCRPTGEYMG